MTGRPDSFMTLYIGDYLADTSHLSAAEHGAYLLLIMHYWRTAAPLSDQEETLQRITRMSRSEWRASRNTLRAFFKPAVINGERVLTHTRIEKELQKADVRYANRKAASDAAIAARNAKRNVERNVEPLVNQPQPQPQSSYEEENTNPSDLSSARGKPLARKPRKALEEPDGFAEFYTAYPKHVARRAAVKAYRAAIKRASPAVILAGAIRYATNSAGKEAEYVKHPATWLNADCWADEAAPLAVVGGANDAEAQRIQDAAAKRSEEWERQLDEARKKHATG